MGASRWARQRFGDVADDLAREVPAAIAQAHGYAVAAQVAGNTRKQDPYGHTLKNTQHECLVAAVGDLPGAAVFRPKGVSFELVRFPARDVVLYPWRYATSHAQPRETARMDASGFRRGLLAGDAPTRQLTLDEHAQLSEEELDRQLAEEADVLEQLRSWARVVTIGYASNVHALLAVGWGDAELVDDQGTVEWRHWEDLPLVHPAALGQDVTAPASAARDGVLPDTRAAAAGAPGPAARFDAGPADDDFDLRPRNPLAGEPTQEPLPPRPETGTGHPDAPDERS